MEITAENVKSKMDPKAKPLADFFMKVRKGHEFKLPSEPPIFECILYKKQKILKKEKPGKYRFFDDRVLYIDFSKKPVLKGVLFFNFSAKLEFIKKMGPNKQKLNMETVGLRIIKDGQEKEWFSPQVSLLEKVMKFLKKRIFQVNFHQNYKALKQLGRGNFATVYKSENIITKEKYAVKAFSKENFTNKEEKGYELLLNEIKIMRTLDHPNITSLNEIYETEKSIYLVLDLYKGKSLDQYLDEEGKLDESKASIILIGLLNGISYLHSKKIMHRDIKLQNILFKKKEKKLTSQNLIIVDFGLAQYENDEKYIYTRCGTPGYVAPEVLRAKDPKSKYTCACDVFSTGILLHLLLTGSKPFNTKNYNEVLNENKRFHFNKSDPRYSFLSNEAVDLLEKMLETDPVRRISISAAKSHDFFCSENLLSYPDGRSSLIFMTPEINMKKINSATINMEKKNRFLAVSGASPFPKSDNRQKGSFRMFDFPEKNSEDDTVSESLNDQSMFSNFYFNKSAYGQSVNNKAPNHNESSANDSKNSFERNNNKNFSIKFVSGMRFLNSMEKRNSKVISINGEIEEMEKKSNNSFHSAKGKTVSTNTNHIRYSIDRNFKFDYEALKEKENANSNYHPKFWTNEDIQKLYGCKLKFNSVNSSSNGSLNFVGVKGEEENMKVSNI